MASKDSTNKEDLTVHDMSDKLSSASFGDSGDQGLMDSAAGLMEGFDHSEDDKLGDSMMDFDDTHELDESDECLRAPQPAVWDIAEPSEDYLNKLDGWSPKQNTSSRDDSTDMSLDSIPLAALESWLKENLPDDYHGEYECKTEKKAGLKEKRKSRVRWADIETRLQNMGIMLHSGYDSAASGSEA